MKFDACVKCGGTDKPHMARGRCSKCYLIEYNADPENAERIKASKDKHYKKRSRLEAKILREERSHDDKRDSILIRDGYKCVLCGRGTEAMLVVHHRDGNGRGSKTPNNSDDNLETQCRSCHATTHGIIETWARDYDACQMCGRSDRRHNAFGYCVGCYWKAVRDGLVIVTPKTANVGQRVIGGN